MKNLINSSARSLTVMIVLFMALSFSNSCSKDDTEQNSVDTSTPANPNEILIQGSSFSPATITIQAGTKITWRNKDGMTHTVTSDSGIFDSGNLASNGSYSYTFATPGSYPYHCNLHAGMTGTVTVN
ncbi:MAG: cupredoxin family copper-binding protein [Chloroflexota bacterium]